MRTLLIFEILALLFIHARADCPHERAGLKAWSQASTWGVNGAPQSGDSITITDKILMDVAPPPLYNISIKDGGMLTFSPEVDLVLKAANIYIQKHGSMHIGCGDCPYRGKLEIVLTGNRKSHEHETHPKAILVDEGGTLEIHGAPKLSWTKIDKTLNPERGYDGGNIFFNHQWENQYNSIDPFASRIVAYTFGLNSTGYPFVKDFGLYEMSFRGDELVRHIGRVVDGDILMMAVQVQIRLRDPSVQSTGVYDAYETLVHGEVTGNSMLRSLQDDGSTWAFVYQKGNSKSLSEETNAFGTTSTARYVMSEDMIFTAETVGNLRKGLQQENFMISNRNALNPLVEAVDDVTTWQQGDQIVIASTDYDWEQAEERTIVFCPDCQKNQFRINEPVKFMHFGNVLYGAVDMRAEVGMLTKNVVIRGEMEAECPEFNENCHDSKVRGLDTFGAHIKILQNYSNVHIGYAELINVGQQTDNGRYPVHFHMTFDKKPGARVPYLRGNSIHNTFARCVTIHGTHGVQVLDNFCYNHMGHGFFLEDGGEKNNVFDGNLAMSTRSGNGSLEPVDRFRPAGFWFTSPLNRFRNNVAAGGEGTGIWVVFPDEPLPPSRTYGLYDKFEARQTMLMEFDNNVGHSQGQFGIMIGNKETDERNVEHSNKWQPLVDPKDPTSSPLDIPISKLTGYKCRGTNIWIEGGYLNVSRISVSDSRNGIFVTNEGQQDRRSGRLSHAVILGDSENVGEPSIDGFDRSFPLPWNEKFRVKPHSGITMWKGPTQYSDIWFNGFQSNNFYDIAAIAKRRNSPYFFSVTTPFKNLQFAFDDGEGQGNYAISGVNGVDPGWDSEKDGGKISGFTFYNSTSTQEEKLYIVKPDHFSAAAADCKVRPNWRLAICKTKYGNLRLSREFKNTKSNGIFVRDDLPSAQLELKLETRTGPPVVLDGSRTYTFHSVGQMPYKLRFTADGIETGDTLRIGVCTPIGAEVEIQSLIPRLSGKERLITRSRFTRVNSLGELDAPDADLDGKKYFMNDTTGMVYFKFVGNSDLDIATGETCGGGRCPDFRVIINSGDLSDGDCRQRLYGGSLNMTKPPLPTFSETIKANGGASPPEGYGAGITRPFVNRENPVDGQYGLWTEWSQCSTTCDQGTRYRTRRCDSPLPANGGAECVGAHLESQTCNLEPCAIKGGFTDWSEWSACQAFDAGYCTGFSERSRSCSNPAARFGGLSCEGNTREIQRCTVC